MKTDLRFERLVIEGLLAAFVGTMLLAVLYSAWWRSCCEAASSAISTILLPGYVVGWLIGGGPHSASKYHFYAGVAVEFFAVWLLIRAIRGANQRRKSAGSDPQ